MSSKPIFSMSLEELDQRLVPATVTTIAGTTGLFELAAGDAASWVSKVDFIATDNPTATSRLSSDQGDPLGQTAALNLGLFQSDPVLMPTSDPLEIANLYVVSVDPTDPTVDARDRPVDATARISSDPSDPTVDARDRPVDATARASDSVKPQHR